MELRLSYQPPFDWEGMLAFLSPRTLLGVEAVENGRYHRTYRSPEGPGWLSISNGFNLLRIECSGGKDFVARKVTALFDLACDPHEVCSSLQDLSIKNPGLRVPGAFDPFEMSVRAILGQQITVKFATTLGGRFAEAFGDDIETPVEGLRKVFPTAASIAGKTQDDIARLGVIGSRARAILALAEALASGDLNLEPGSDPEEARSRLIKLPGIGEWTAQYICMRALRWSDAFPHTDLGVKKAMAAMGLEATPEAAERWRPYRAYAVMHLWQSLANS
ncbi:MAG TPA: DNA-3-methyladenine glycosylase [Fimbriimonas sp.]|nr:DNA-3-methyladenine glycosylase [Fimbriimonas sp.]